MICRHVRTKIQKIKHSTRMIEPEDYKFPTEQQEKPKPKADTDTERNLYDLGFRPHGYEW